ncbi:MAG: RNA-directed DNA polymerase [bacterium]
MTIFTAENLLKAYYNCRTNKRQTINALKFEQDLENNLYSLKETLTAQTYFPGKSICFVVTEPKPREIFAAEFTDRVVHHLLINEIQNHFEKNVFIENSYACRPGKGHHFALKQVQQFAKQFSFYGQFDIANFFASLDKRILYRILSQKIAETLKPLWWQEEILWLAKTIIFSDPTKNFYYKGSPNLKTLVPQGKSLFDQKENVGLPIGNLTSQFFANVYLNELDQFAVKTLGVPGYGRYVDDFLVFSNSKEEIITARNSIKEFLTANLNLKMHPKKQQIQPTRHGIPFVGYFIKPWVVYPRRNTVKKVKSQLFLAVEGRIPVTGKKELVHLQQSLNSYYGHFRHASSYNLRKHLYLKHFDPQLKLLLAPKNNSYNSYSVIDWGKKPIPRAPACRQGGPKGQMNQKPSPEAS